MNVSGPANYYASTLSMDFAPISFPLETDLDSSVWIHFHMRAKSNSAYTSSAANTYFRTEYWKTGDADKFDYNDPFQYSYGGTVNPSTGLNPLSYGTASAYADYRFMFGSLYDDVAPNDPDMPDDTVAVPDLSQWWGVGVGSNLLDALTTTGLTVKLCSYTQIELTQRDLMDISEFRLVTMYDGPPMEVPSAITGLVRGTRARFV